MIRLLLLQRPKTARMQFLRYFFVGGMSAVVDLIAYSVLVKYLDIHYIPAAFVGYMLGLAWNHFLCIFWVFESKHHRAKEVTMVFSIALGGLLWTWAILYALIGIFGMD